MDKPKISIVTPSFNQGHFIEETICSVLDQGYSNLEYVIIDGGSTDQTVDIIRKYERHLKYWVSEPDHGQSDAINKGLKHCTGDIFNWLNSDDYLAASALEKVATLFQSKDDVHVVSGRKVVIKNGCEDYLMRGTIVNPTLEQTLIDCRIDQPSTFWNLKTFTSLGKLDVRLHYLMDANHWRKYLLKYGKENIVECDEVLAYFRVHDSSKTNQFQDRFKQQLWGLHAGFINNLPTFSPYLVKCIEEVFGQIIDSKYIISQKIDLEYLESLYYECLIRELYSVKAYKQCRLLIKGCFVKGYLKQYLIGYIIKVFLIPTPILNYIRSIRHS